MREWKRAPADMICGLCRHRAIPRGEPYLSITLPNVKRERRRCQNCAGEAPPELPPLTPNTPIQARTKKMTHLMKSRPEWLPHPQD